MAVGTFIIRERPDIGGVLPPGGQPFRFEWTADRRNTPIQPWSMGVTQRTARTDYPGADNPTEQVLGPNFKPFTLTGRWSDKFNFGGYAIQTWRNFLAMVRRGNLCEFSFQSLTFFGIITDFDWDYRREYDIGYSFTVSVHRRPGADPLSKNIFQPLSITRDANSLAKSVQARILNDMAITESLKPSQQLVGDISATSTAQLQAMQEAADEFNAVVEERVLETDADATLSVRRAIAAADKVIGSAQTRINEVAGLRSDTALSFQSALGVLDFETWSRGLSSQARLSVFESFDARQQLDRQAQPDAIALYRPFKGESLYSISNRFYRTPHNWRLIKERNRLDSSILTGTELLIIPEAPPQ